MLCSFKPRAIARDTWLAPIIKIVLGEGWRTPSNLATGIAVKLCSTTVTIITVNINGTIFSASATPASIILNANTEPTAAATIPRGAIQASTKRDFIGKSVPKVEIAIHNGRAINSTIAKNINTSLSSIIKSESCNLAASKINKVEIKIIERSSLNSSTESISKSSWLANQIPNTVTANKPDSWLI